MCLQFAGSILYLLKTKQNTLTYLNSRVYTCTIVAVLFHCIHFYLFDRVYEGYLGLGLKLFGFRVCDARLTLSICDYTKI